MTQQPDRPTSSTLTVRAAQADEADIVARVRAHCYGMAAGDVASFRKRMDRSGDVPADLAAGDVLLAERKRVGETVIVGTATGLSGQIAVRGTLLPCQGVAWVGTTHEARRSGGIASAVMNATLRQARDRKQVISALMPFRHSFYEHFGYGVVERRASYTIPLPILPSGDVSSFRFATDADTPELSELRRRQVANAHGDILFSETAFARDWRAADEVGYRFIDRDPATNAARGGLTLAPLGKRGQKLLDVDWQVFTDPAAFVRQLHLLASLRDQYSFARLKVPADWPITRLLREAQLPHRPVEHHAASCKLVNRMQIRILDHKRFCEAMSWPDDIRGRVSITVAEPEGETSRFSLEIDGGRCSVSDATDEADVTLPASLWATAAMGETSASSLAHWGLIEATDPNKLPLLDALARGPLPFSRQYF